jgi:hypothetical protein
MIRQKATPFADKLHLQRDQDNLGKAQNFITMMHLHEARAKKVNITAGQLERNIRDLKERHGIKKVVLIHRVLVHRITRTNNAPAVPKVAVKTLRPHGNESLECAKMVSHVAVVPTKDATAFSTYTKKILLGANLIRAQVIRRKESMEFAWMASPASAACNRVATVINTSLKKRAEESKIREMVQPLEFVKTGGPVHAVSNKDDIAINTDINKRRSNIRTVLTRVYKCPDSVTDSHNDQSGLFKRHN